ncbi:UNVERIFIED_CONTAM: hypothetical protein FKN15_046433 [Acipenser sinensis]
MQYSKCALFSQIHSTARFQNITAVSMLAQKDDSHSYEAPCLESYSEGKIYTMYHEATKEGAESIKTDSNSQMTACRGRGVMSAETLRRPNGTHSCVQVKKAGS